MSSVTEKAAIVAFLAARLDEEEGIARGVTADDWGDEPGCSSLEWEDLPDSAFTHAKRHGPARVLCEIEIDRELIARYEKFVDWPRPSRYQAGVADTYAEVIQLRTQRFSDHPDFLEGWAIF